MERTGERGVLRRGTRKFDRLHHAEVLGVHWELFERLNRGRFDGM